MGRIRVLVTGAGGPAGMGTIKSLLGKGMEVIAADMNPLAAGLYWTPNRIIVPHVGAKDYIRKILETVKQHRIDVLFPTVDEEIELLARNLDKFKKVTHILISPLESAKSCTDKWMTYTELTRLKVPVIETCRIDTIDDIDKAVERLGFPMAIKPMVSRGGRGLFYCKDMGELMLRYAELWELLPFRDTYYSPKTSHRIIAQELLPGTEYDVCALRSRKGDVIANVPMRNEIWDVKEQRRMIVTEHNKTAMSLAKKTMDSLDLMGPVDIEMKEDKNGEMKILDINPRVGGDIELATAAGCNIPALTVKLAVGGKTRYTDFKNDYVLLRFLGIQTMRKDDIPKR